jgi:phage tail-like protein
VIPALPQIEDPLVGHRFLVSLDPADAYLPPAQAALITLVAAGSFASVTGLEATLDVLTYFEGGRNDSVLQLPTRHSYSKLILTRGIVRDPGLFFWYQAGRSQSLGARRDGAIVLLTPLGVPAIGWIFRGGLACGWKGPELNATSNAVAVETISIAHEGLWQVPLSPPGFG